MSNLMGIFPPVPQNRILLRDIPRLTTDYVFIGQFRDPGNHRPLTALLTGADTKLLT